MYTKQSRKSIKYPSQTSKTDDSNPTQKKASKTSSFLKPNQPNIFREHTQPKAIVQERAELASYLNGGLNQTFDEKSDKVTHSKHMTATGVITKSKKGRFTQQSHSNAERMGNQQAVNRVSRELQTLEKKGELTPAEQAKVTQLKANNTGLPDSLKSGVECLSGISLNDVKVHFNSPRPAQLHALAYTQGTDIHVAPGQEKHLAHEAWHVVQQKQGRVKPTTQLMDVSINDDTELEREADIMGAKAVIQGKSVIQENSVTQKKSAIFGASYLTSENIVQRRACLRCMCEAELNQIKATGFFQSRGSEAKWCTFGEKTTEPNINSYGDANHDHLISFNIKDSVFTEHQIWYDENDRPKESEHMNDIIGKKNEPGNFGLGCNLLPTIPVKPFEWTRKDKKNSSKPWEKASAPISKGKKGKRK